MLYPAKDLLFYQADVASNLLDQQRMEVMRRLAEEQERPKGGAGGNRSSGNAAPEQAAHTTVVLPVAALMDYVTKLPVLKAERILFKWGEETDYGEARRVLVQLGYERCAQVSMPGQFASRGDILDIWPLTEEHPVRIEFFDNEVDSLRAFEPE